MADVLAFSHRPVACLSNSSRRAKAGRAAMVARPSKEVTTCPSKEVTNGAKKRRVQEVDEEDFERRAEKRLRLPHITDIWPSLEPVPTTFMLKNTPVSCPLPREDEDVENIYVHNDDRVLLKTISYASPTSVGAECVDGGCEFKHQWAWRAGPRSKIYMQPEEVKAAIVTCGGLCPGLNDVIRQIVLTLEAYGVTNIAGFRYGYRGMFDDSLSPLKLSRDVVQNIHLSGGSLLGVSRGGGKPNDIVDGLQKHGINMLFVLGGNGTHAGAQAIHAECWRRKLKVIVVGVPKTIDNDIMLMDRTFGFETAVEEAQRAISAAYTEATSAYHGIGIVKLMGRQSGFIAMHASLSSGLVDVCLIPEVPFLLDGPTGVLQHLENLVKSKGSAVVCVAEGAGQELLPSEGARDASGNPVLSDIGVHLQERVKKYFKDKDLAADVKYIDPTYMIRACRANSADRILCADLGQNAVHGALAGFSGITVGLCNNHSAYLPIPEVISQAKTVDPSSRMWHRCLTSTGQPDFSPDLT